MMYLFLYFYWILIVISMNKFAADFNKTRAEKYLPNPYLPLPDIIQEKLPSLNVKTPDKLLFISMFYTIYIVTLNSKFNIFYEQLNILLYTLTIRPVFCCLTILPACMPEPKEERSIYDKLFLSTHDLMYSGHTCIFICMGKIIDGYIGSLIQYIFPITLVMAKIHYSIDIFVSMFVYNYLFIYNKS